LLWRSLLRLLFLLLLVYPFHNPLVFPPLCVVKIFQLFRSLFFWITIKKAGDK
jgi:hypothetical protein